MAIPVSLTVLTVSVDVSKATFEEDIKECGMSELRSCVKFKSRGGPPGLNPCP